MSIDAKQKPTLSFKQKIRWLAADTDTPISLYLRVAGRNEGILLESAEVDGRWGRYSILATDMCFYAFCDRGKLGLDIKDERCRCLEKYVGMPFVDGLRALMADLEILPEQRRKDLPPITRALYGYLGFGMASLFNPVLTPIMPVEEADCILALPSTVLVFDHLYNRLCQLSLGEHRDLGGEAASNIPVTSAAEQCSAEAEARPDENGYKDFVRNIREQLRNGEAIQIVPSVRFSVPFSGNPFNLYRRMRRINASPYMFYMRFPQLSLFGSSPEVMVRCTENQLLLSPIAGTRKRGADEAEDAALAAELLADPKERAEHVMLVDLGRNDLGRIAKPGSVRLEKYMDVERFSHVMHLTSRVTATLGSHDGKPYDALDVLAATFPAGTVSGAPKIRAIQIIRELEGAARGPYAGCIGWIGLDHDSVNLDMGITIRSMWATGGKLYWQAGGGIVHDSNPENEWKEVCNKSAIMRMVLQPEDENNVPANR